MANRKKYFLLDPISRKNTNIQDRTNQKFVCKILNEDL